jgi:hypothetical protein
MSREAEIAEGEGAKKQEKKVEGYNFTEEQLIEIKKFIHEKRMLLQAHPECPDHQAIHGFEQHLDRRLAEIAWTRYKKEKGID